jgi:manganese/zinc/iron transport system permease protein
VTVIIGLPAVGVVMIAALLILPAASARFWTDRLDHMLAISAAMGAAIGLTGTLMSANLSRMPTGPLIVLSGTGLFAISALFAPRRGLIIQWWKRKLYRQNALNQHILGEVARLSHGRAHPVRLSIDELASRAAVRISAIRKWAKLAARNGWIEVEPAGELVVTDTGQSVALEIAAAQRAWIRFAENRPDAAAKVAELDILMAVNRIRVEEDSPPT